MIKGTSRKIFQITSSVRSGKTDVGTPQENCTRRLSPKRLPRKKNELPIVVTPYAQIGQ